MLASVLLIERLLWKWSSVSINFVAGSWGELINLLLLSFLFYLSSALTLALIILGDGSWNEDVDLLFSMLSLEVFFFLLSLIEGIDRICCVAPERVTTIARFSIHLFHSLCSLMRYAMMVSKVWSTCPINKSKIELIELAK